MVYTCVNSVRKATGLEWHPKNKKLAMQILEKRLQEEVFNVKFPTYKTITDLIKQFHQDRVSKLDRSTQLKYLRVYKDFFIEDFSLDDVQLIRMKIIERKNQLNNNLVTIRKKLSMLKTIFNYAVELGWMEKNPIVPSMMPTVQKKEIKIVTDGHIRKIKEYFERKGRKDLSLIVEFVYLTAIRIGEMTKLRWEHVTDRYFVIQGKGSRQRIFPLSPFPRVSEILMELRDIGLEIPGRYKTEQLLERHLKSAVKYLQEQFPEMKFEGITFHVLRKGAINRWRMLGIDQELRNILAGHTREVEKNHYLAVPDIELLETRLMKTNNFYEHRGGGK